MEEAIIDLINLAVQNDSALKVNQIEAVCNAVYNRYAVKSDSVSASTVKRFCKSHTKKKKAGEQYERRLEAETDVRNHLSFIGAALSVNMDGKIKEG